MDFCTFCKENYLIQPQNDGKKFCVPVNEKENCRLLDASGKCEECHYGYYMDGSKRCVETDLYKINIYGY